MAIMRIVDVALADSNRRLAEPLGAQTITCEVIAGLCDPSDSRHVAHGITCDAADLRGDSHDELSHSYDRNGAALDQQPIAEPSIAKNCPA